MRALLEGDGSQVNVKGATCEMQARHFPAILTSNLTDIGEFKRQAKECGVRSSWTSADFQKILSVEEGRIGCEARTEEQVLHSNCYILLINSSD